MLPTVHCYRKNVIKVGLLCAYAAKLCAVRTASPRLLDFSNLRSSFARETFGGGGGLYISWSTVPLSRAVVIMLRGKISQVWMDDYKRLFYMHRPDLVNIQIGKE